MPAPKLTFNLLIGATLALSGAFAWGQSSSGTTPAPAPPSTPSSAPSSAPAAPSSGSANSQPAADTAKDCSGPVLHEKNGDVCSDQLPAPPPSRDTDTAAVPI